MKKILKNKGGFALIYVLAIMLALLAVGVSAITAASLSRGASIAQKHRTQLDLYVGSMERTIDAQMVTLGDDLGTINTLGDLLLLHVFNALEDRFNFDSIDPDYTPYQMIPPRILTLPPPYDCISISCMNSRLLGTDINFPLEDVEYGINIVWNDIYVVIAHYRRYDVATGLSALPLNVTVSGEVAITLTTKYTAPNGEDFIMVTRTTYRISGVNLQEGTFNDVKTIPPESGEMEITYNKPWEFIRHETNPIF
ncbi:MAG: hypothetical protein FWB80_06670 [Defluviitaleaceae bacterium]|nr:hypothetical protein [Defluviitaleaceae bacterium]